MRLCRFSTGYGMIDGEVIRDITDYVSVGETGGASGDPLVLCLPRLRSLGPDVVARLKSRALSECEFLSPVRRPSKIMAAPNNYRDHTAEMHQDGAADPSRMGTLGDVGFFLKASTSLVGPSEGVSLRFPGRRTDHEVELVVVIGDVVSGPLEESQASSAVAGYCIGLDMTLRGPEERSLRKSIDSYTVLGPALVTPDEVGNLSSCRMQLSVNGELRQSVQLSDMLFGVEAQISYASRFYTLYPGDLIYTGTPAGVGRVHPGDVISANISDIGEMTVRVR